jgi:hypothetical protein
VAGCITQPMVGASSMPPREAPMLFRSTPSGDDPTTTHNLHTVVRTLLWWLAITVAIVSVWTVATALRDQQAPSLLWRALALSGQAWIVSGGAFAVGALLGFLFGIPRSLQGNPPASPAPAGAAADANGPTQAVNTNLEQISDWLTKILVGVGLTQFQSLRNELAGMAAYFAIAGSAAVTLAIILNSSVAGFFAGYLLTRLFLMSAFDLVNRDLERGSQVAKQLEAEGRHDAALDVFQANLEKVTPTTPKATRDDQYEGAIFNALYQTAPKGFETAIQLGDDYLSQERIRPRGRILAFLAAAYGQRYAHLRSDPESPEAELVRARRRAVDYIRQALEADPTTKPLLRMMWDPNSPGKSPGDDDLEIFFREEDPDVRALLG